MSIAVNYGNVITEIQMSEKEIEIMTNAIKSIPENGLMVEWGSGGSTCKWIETLKPTQNLISIEHNENWFNRVKRAIKNEWPENKNFEYIFEPEKYGFKHGYATPIEEHPLGTDFYLNPTDKIWDADIFFIDGIARSACSLYVLLKHRKKNPLIFIHDYVGREPWYEWSVQLFDRKIFNDDERDCTLVQLNII